MSYASETAAALRQAVGASDSLLAKLVRWQLASLVALIACVCVTLYVGLISLSNWSEDQTLTRKHMNVSAVLGAAAEQEYWLGHEVSEDMDGPRRIFVRTILPGGAVLLETPDMSGSLPDASFPRLGRGQQMRHASVSGPDGRRYRVLVARAWIDTATGSREGLVQIAIDRTLDQAVLRRFEMLTLAVALAAILAAGLIGAYQVSRLLAPLHRMAAEIKAIEHTSLDRRVDTEGLTQELRHLGSQFNDLLARLGVAYDGLKHYADNVAHEMRTPLNKMLLEIDVVQQHPRTAAQHEEMNAQLADSCRELKTLVERLLFLARASKNQAGLARQQVDLQQEMEAVREYYAASAIEAGVRLVLAPGPKLKASVDRTLLQRAITNLVTNALSHTPSGGEIRLSLRRTGDGAAIEVRDTGNGIAPEDLPHIFDRFYRADKQRVAGAGRVGLGLTIAKSIIELHGGAIGIDSELGKGTRVTLTLADAVAVEVAVPAPAHA